KTGRLLRSLLVWNCSLPGKAKRVSGIDSAWLNQMKLPKTHDEIDGDLQSESDENPSHSVGGFLASLLAAARPVLLPAYQAMRTTV
ncbi:MAG: hypothetical protein O7E56_00075, partial [SAR324 cluster bacterium]|nr:hypothetical protein [SAR324 cluster bacterium]